MRADPGFTDHPASTIDDTRLGTLSALFRSVPRPASRSVRRQHVSLALGAEIVVIGPGDMETAHSERECVPIVELNAWTELVKQPAAPGNPHHRFRTT